MLKIDGSLARNIDFEVANFEVDKKTRRKTSILKLHSVRVGGSLARNACFDAPTCLVSSLWFSSGLAVSMEEVAKPILVRLTVSKQVVMWFCVAGVALRNILMCLQTCRKSFCVASAILLRPFQKMSCIFCGRRSTLETSIVILRGRRSIWFRSAVYGMLFLRGRRSISTLHTLHFTLHT